MPARLVTSASRPRAGARGAHPRRAESMPVGATSFIASPEPRPRKIRPGARQPALQRPAQRPPGGSGTSASARSSDEHARGLRGQGAEPRQRCGECPPSCRTAGSGPRRRRCRDLAARRSRRRRAARPARTARRTPCSRGAVGGGRGKRHRLRRDGSPFPWRVAGRRARQGAAARQVAPGRRAGRRRPRRPRAVPDGAGRRSLPRGGSRGVRRIARRGGARRGAHARSRGARRRRARSHRERGRSRSRVTPARPVSPRSRRTCRT